MENGKSSASSPSNPLVWEVMFHPGFPDTRSGPRAERRWRETGTPGRGRRERARPGAAPTSSTVSGMQIRYSFSSMVLPATDLRGGKRGAPPRPTRLPPRRKAGRSSEPAAKQPSRCAQLLASSSPPESMSRFGSGVRGSPASFLAEVGPPGTRCCKVGSEGGRPAGNATIGSLGR